MKLFFVHAVLTVLLVSTSCTEAFAQKQVTRREQSWVAYFNQTRLTKTFGFWLDVQWRQTGDFVDRPHQFLLRPALTFFIKDNLRFNTGYCFVNNFPPEGLETSRPEHRMWEQIWWNQKYAHFTMLQWLRLEQRFLRNISNDQLQDGYTHAHRLRCNVAFSIPLKGNELVAGTPFASISNELFLNLGKNVVYNTFDQNRFFVGAGYQATSSLNVQLGYLNVFQQEASGNSYQISHVIRLAVNQSLDLRKKG